MPRKIYNSDSEAELEDDVTSDHEDDGQLLVESESDEAPDDVGFLDSKRTVLEKVQNALSQIKDDKERQKAKRKSRDDNYKLQKKQKLAELEKKKLPEDLLQSLPSKSLKVQKAAEDSHNTEDAEDRLAHSGDENEQEDEGSSDGEDSFIPLEKSGGIEVLPLKDLKKKTLSSAEAAREFRDRRLYGPGVARVAVSTHLSIKQKRKAC